MDKRKLTAENGRPIADNQNIQTAGERGPVLLQDPWYTEKIAHFDREVIPAATPIKPRRCLLRVVRDAYLRSSFTLSAPF